MFERFSDDAREVVIGAQAEARALRHRRIGTEHLLLGVLADPGSAAGAVLNACGMSAGTVRQAIVRQVDDPDAQAAALETIGIDLDRVRAAVESTFGEGALERAGRPGRSGRGHIPFTDAAKKVLELSLREAIRLKDRTIGSEHILLGLLREGRGLGAHLLADAQVDREVVEAALTGRRRRAG